jgi:uncharacterized protein YqjF (DUF2071 family)
MRSKDALIARSKAITMHEPWSLQSATLDSCESTMIESLGVTQPTNEPLLHYAESIAVEIWPLKAVRTGSRSDRVDLTG